MKDAWDKLQMLSESRNNLCLNIVSSMRSLINMTVFVFSTVHTDTLENESVDADQSMRFYTYRKRIQTSVWTWPKTKSVQRQLNSECEKLLENYDEFAAKAIWRRVRRQVERSELELLHKACCKFTLATPYNPVQQETHHNPSEGEYTTKKRHFTRNRPFSIAPHSNH